MAPSAGRNLLLIGALFVLFVGANAQNGTTIQINFIAANGPVVVGKFLQFTTLLRNSGPSSYNGSNGTNVTVVFNGTLSVTCSDAYLLNVNSTLASPGCNEQITIPPYAVGSQLNESYPGCDVNPQGLIDLNTTTGPVRYPTSVTADGHTATWTNVILAPGVTTALPVVGFIQYQQPILCLATFGPSDPTGANSTILNAPSGVNGTSSNTLQKGTIFNSILQPPSSRKPPSRSYSWKRNRCPWAEGGSGACADNRSRTSAFAYSYSHSFSYHCTVVPTSFRLVPDTRVNKAALLKKPRYSEGGNQGFLRGKKAGFLRVRHFASTVTYLG
ncbi:hypothetical protein KFL_002620150 [Klebsormidium nitens]|uniref:DUF11 domain-containing protein n=1 Tax=Klebsormidium nitens TaxID=105231 RepID=A0A1Y1I954_KLENI|nr:hypothetical protein KFL_002620150 [Klebsormidium nitens]|eukprot:GAQ85949.1 hypothetical protein KFL_002620150 [Klebsormidium nitens]